MELLDTIRYVGVVLLIITYVWWVKVTKRLQSSTSSIISETRNINNDMKETLDDMKEDRDAIIQVTGSMESHASAFEEEIREFKEIFNNNVMKHVQLLNRKVEGLGARWGIQSENAFRSGMESILTETGYSVEKYRKHDTKGVVFGHPGEEVEIDVVTRNGRTFLVEIKSRIDRSDVVTFDRLTKFYEAEENRTAYSKILISPFIDERAKRLAEKFGITLCTDTTDFPKDNIS